MAREWERREPTRKDVVEYHIFCPTCDKELDSGSCFNDGTDCECGRWTYALRMAGEEPSGYYFKRKETEEEIREALQQRKVQLERELSAVKEQLGE